MNTLEKRVLAALIIGLSLSYPVSLFLSIFNPPSHLCQPCTTCMVLLERRRDFVRACIHKPRPCPSGKVQFTSFTPPRVSRDLPFTNKTQIVAIFAPSNLYNSQENDSYHYILLLFLKKLLRRIFLKTIQEPKIAHNVTVKFYLG